MSVSLRFPTYLSNIIVSKGVGHLEPNWNFSLSNNQLSIKLTWNNVPTESLILSPPPLAATAQNLPNTYTKPYVKENRSFCPPRFQRKYFSGKQEKTNSSSISTSAMSNGPSRAKEVNNSDTDVLHSDSPHSQNNIKDRDIYQNRTPSNEVPCSNESSCSNVSSGSFEAPCSIEVPCSNVAPCSNEDPCKPALLKAPEEINNSGDSVMSSIDNTYLQSFTNGQSLNSSFDSLHSNIHGSPNPTDDEYGDSESESVLENSTYMGSSGNGELSTLEEYTNSVLIDDIETKQSDHVDTNIFDINVQNDFQCSDTTELLNVHESSVPSSAVQDNNVELSPTCLPKKGVSKEDIVKWIADMEKFLRNNERFSPLVDATWSRSERVKYRGLEDDSLSGRPAQFRASDLKSLFDPIGDFCPLSKAYIRKSSTCLMSIWHLVYIHYGLKIED